MHGALRSAREAGSFLRETEHGQFRVEGTDVDKTLDPRVRRELAENLRELRAYYRKRGVNWYGNRFCRCVVGNFYTGLALAPGPDPRRNEAPAAWAARIRQERRG
jgi:hypothetical protein